MIKTRTVLLLCALAAVCFATAEADVPGDLPSPGVCPLVRIVPERLPDLNIPRTGHSTFYANGELTVAGGHTTNFVPTPTAEYYADGGWHLMPMAYSHDNGFVVVMRSGEVIIGGGHSEPLGIGQTFMVEHYLPATHSFEGFGCLDRRRVLAGGTQLADGRVIIAGNHYAADDIACYDGQSQVQRVKQVVQGHSNPYILPTAADNAVILGAYDTYDIPPDTVWAEQVNGDAFRVPLLEQWKLVYFDMPFSSEACSMGDGEHYAYLLTVTDKSGQMAFVQMSDTCGQAADTGTRRPCFSLLPTTCPVPMESPFGPIFYQGPVITDKSRQRGYVLGIDSLSVRQYLLAIDYAKRPAELTLYYTDTLEQATVIIPVVTPDGDLILAGGISNSNYKPYSAVWRYHFGIATTAADETLHRFSFPAPLWGLLVVVVIAALAYIIYYMLRRRKRTVAVTVVPAAEDIPDEELMERICQFMEEDERYLKALRQSDIAAGLGVSTAKVSDCIVRSRGCTFGQMLAEYRVHHAQKLLAGNPELKLAAVIAQSGFTSESTFFRSFKAVTGKSPKEWLAEQ